MTIHYHGTCVTSAVESLLAGEPLDNHRPSGRSSIPGSRAGMVYMTPAFGQAAEYAFRWSREDWPSEHAVTTIRDHGWVFGFEDEPLGAIPDEDEVGHAARAALAFDSMGGSSWSCMNQSYSERVNADEPFRRMLLARMRATPRIATMIDGLDPRRIRGPVIVRLGRAVRNALTEDELAWTLSLGPSIAVPPGMRPALAYRLDRLVFDPAGLEAVQIDRCLPTP